MHEDDQLVRARFGYLLIPIPCVYFIWQAAEQTTRQPGGPMAMGEMGKVVTFAFTILPVMVIWIWGHQWVRPASVYRGGLYLATSIAVLVAMRMSLADAPGFQADDDSLVTTVAAYFKGIFAPPGTTSEEPGNYFPASEDAVVFFLCISLLFLLLALWDTWRISRQRKQTTSRPFG